MPKLKAAAQVDPLVKQFFHKYFHHEWAKDDPTPEAVIDKLRKKVDLPNRQKLAEALKKYTDSIDDDAFAEDTIFELGCYYLPNSPAKVWLLHIIDLISKK